MTVKQKRQKHKYGLKKAVKCDYISTEQGRELYSTYNQILKRYSAERLAGNCLRR